MRQKQSNKQPVTLEGYKERCDHGVRWENRCSVCDAPPKQEQPAAEFWQGVYPDGWTAERVEAEMSDYHMVLDGLSALIDHVTGGKCSKPNTDKAVIKALFDDYVTECIEKALAEEKQEQGEPVAWRWMPAPYWKQWVYSDDGERVAEAKHFMSDGGVQPLYTTPQQREPLHQEHIFEAYRKALNQTVRIQDEYIVLKFARAIEDAHGIKEQP